MSKRQLHIEMPCCVADLALNCPNHRICRGGATVSLPHTPVVLNRSGVGGPLNMIRGRRDPERPHDLRLGHSVIIIIHSGDMI